MTASQSPTPRRRAVTIAAALGLTALLASAFAGCSTPLPIIPKGAWSVSFIQPDAINCQIANHNLAIGEVTADTRTKLVEDGEELAAGDTNSVIDVSCSVIAEGDTFAFEASESGLGSFLSLSVPELSKSATKEKPSKGIVIYQSQQTANSFSQSDCDFYFLPKTGQGVSEGTVYLTFFCGAIAAQGDNICKIDPGYAAFEKCEITPDEG